MVFLTDFTHQHITLQPRLSPRYPIEMLTSLLQPAWRLLEQSTRTLQFTSAASLQQRQRQVIQQQLAICDLYRCCRHMEDALAVE
jgi:hypothetical protein